MVFVICIGFHYRERLPALIDITAAHPLLTQARGRRSLVISDLDPRDRCAVAALASHDASDSSLCDRAAALPNYHMFRTSQQLLDTLGAAAGAHVVLYYSGHNDASGMILPNGETLAWSRVMEALRCRSFVGVFDCCRAPRLRLPFSWRGAGWHCDENVAAEYRSELVLLICNTGETEDSFSSSIGSPFTLQLIAWLSGSIRNFAELTRLCPTARIYSSLPAAPSWDSVVR